MFQKNAVYFHLYTSIDAESVIVITSDNRSIQLDQGCSGNKHYWTNRQPFYPPNDQRDFRYRYIATFQKNIVKRFLHWIATFGEDSNETINEVRFRRLNGGTYQYDMFLFPGNRESDQCRFAGYLCFVDMLYGKIQGDKRNNLPQILTECENVLLGFSWIHKADIQKFLNWIEQVISKGNAWHHVAFICSILGQMVMQLKNHSEIFYCMSPKIANQLLNLLTVCEYDQIPQSSVDRIKLVAKYLLQAGDQRGWLAFLSYFANLFEVDRLLEIAVSLPSEKYSDELFNILAAYVVDLLKSLAVSDSSKICNFVAHNCHSICCLWHFYRELSVQLPDLTNALGELFSKRFCELISCRTRGKKVDLLQADYWKMIPIELRVKLAEPFVEALHQQVEHDTLSEKSLLALRRYTADNDICASKPFVAFIGCLTQNRNEDIIRIVLAMLDSASFLPAWDTWSYKEKSDICTSLLKTIFQFQNPFRRKTFRDKVIQVLEAEKKIGETHAVQRDQTIKLALEECVIKLLHNVNIKSIFDAFVDIDTSSQIMQSCYSSLLRDAVKRSGTSGDTSQIKTLLHFLDARKKDYQNGLHSAEFER